MASYADILTAKAVFTLAGSDYNRYLDSFIDPTGRISLFYEVPLLQERPWSHLRDQVFPAFVRFLRSKSLDPETGEGVLVAFFLGERCYLIEGPKFLQAFREIEGLSSSAFHFRVLQWLAR
jgi:hypothetical protein